MIILKKKVLIKGGNCVVSDHKQQKNIANNKRKIILNFLSEKL